MHSEQYGYSSLHEDFEKSGIDLSQPTLDRRASHVALRWKPVLETRAPNGRTGVLTIPVLWLSASASPASRGSPSRRITDCPSGSRFDASSSKEPGGAFPRADAARGKGLLEA